MRVLWLLQRPPVLFIVLAMVLGGFGFAHWDHAAPAQGLGRLAWTSLAWAALSAGTLWLNADVDRDSGEVLLGHALPVPDGLNRWAYAALLVAMGLACGAGVATGAVMSVCVVLSVTYSHQGVLWKGHPVFGPAVNWLGYGILTPYAGYLASGLPATARGLVLLLALSLAVLGAYFSAQAFQLEEDRTRGYRTLVVTRGPEVTLRVAQGLMTVAWLGLVGMSVAGWLPRALLLIAPLWFWVWRWFRTWRSMSDGGTEWMARGLVKRCATLAFISFVLVFVIYVRESVLGLPVAGQGTAVVFHDKWPTAASPAGRLP